MISASLNIKRLTTLLGLSLYGCIGCGVSTDSKATTHRDEPISGEYPTSNADLFWVDLASGSGWRIADEYEDPYIAARDGRKPCSITDFGEEYGGIEVSTTYCDYATLIHPLNEAIRPGDLIELVMWHGPLVSERSAQGEINVSILGENLWSQALTIPGSAQSWHVTIEATFSAPEGTPLIFHVHNHGSNAYTLLSVRRGRSQDSNGQPI